MSRYKAFKVYGILAAFILITAAILIPNFTRARTQGAATSCPSNLKNIGTSLEMYSVDHSGRYPKTLSELIPDYLGRIPECPQAGKDTYSNSYQMYEEPDKNIYRYTFYCEGHYHKNMTEPDYPQYTSTDGCILTPLSAHEKLEE
jgi:competence protein ComGC